MNTANMQQVIDASKDEQFSGQQEIRQFLTFIMDDEEYGIDILSVQEIRGWECTTVIPNAPDFVRGVLNLRGTIVPIIDLRSRFNLHAIEYGATTVIIVVKVERNDGDKVMGIVVDAVSDVYSIAFNQAKPMPKVGDGANDRFLDGLVTVGEKMVVLLNLNQTLDLTN